VPPRCTPEARNRALAPGGTAPGAVGLWPLIKKISWRSHASGSGDGGGLGGDSSWGAGCGGDVGHVDRQ
jgi:hypothetical protein